MKKQSIALFRLIKSLSKFEKGYYVKYVNSLPGKGGERYVQLFHIVDGMKQYDEEGLDMELKKQGFPKQTHRIKNYLYTSILECLQRVNRNGEAINKSLNYLDQAHLLHNKALYKQSSTHASNALRLANNHGHRNLALEALDMMYQNNIAMHENLLENKGLEIREEAFELSGAEFQFNAIARAQLTLGAAYKKNGPAQSNQERESYLDLYKQYAKWIDKELFDTRCEIQYYHLEMVLGYCTRDFEKTVSGIWQAYLSLKEGDHPFGYLEKLLPAWNNCMGALISGRKLKEARKEIEYLEDLMDKEQKKVSIPIFENYLASYHVHTLGLNIMNDKEPLNHELRDASIEFMNHHNCSEYIKAEHLLNLVIFSLFDRQPEEALQYINRFLSDTDYRKFDMAHFAEIQLINLVVHAKLGNDQLLENLIPNLMRKEKLPHKPFAKLLLDHLTAYLNCDTPAAQQQWKATLLDDLDTFYQEYPDEYYWQAVDYQKYFKEVF